jgi:outer membrane protein assembly factor BamB
MARRALIVVCCLCASSAASAQNWPSFRGPAASGVAEGTPTAVKWNAATGEHVLWKTPVAGVAVSSPIVWGERVYVSTAVSSDPSSSIRTGLYGDVEPAKDVSKHTWKLVALDARSGKVVWERVAHDGIRNRARRPRRPLRTAGT